MLELIILFGVGFSTGLSGAMIPGPLFFYTISEALRQGPVAGIKVTVGHLLVETVFVALIILGLREWLAAEGFRTAVAWVGGVGLLIMGALILRRLPHLSLAAGHPIGFHGGAVTGGALFSIISPGFLLWWATIGAAVFLQGALRGVLGIALVAGGHALADLAWHGLIALSVARGRTYCTDRMYRLIMAGVALCLVVLGIGLPIKTWLS